MGELGRGAPAWASARDERSVRGGVNDAALSAQKIITLEENIKAGGFGSTIAEALEDLNIQVPLKIMGIPDKFIEHGARSQLLIDCGLDVENILKEI